MEDLLEILKYVLPSLVVFATAYFLLKLFLEKEQRAKMMEKRMAGSQIVTPIRLQAYERVVLLLERISPGSLVMRVHRPDMTVLQLQTALVQAIRDEFEHNLSQQVYVSSHAWELVKNAKEEMLKLINISMGELNDNASASDLSKKIFEKSVLTSSFPVTVAAEHIKSEIRQLF